MYLSGVFRHGVDKSNLKNKKKKITSVEGDYGWEEYYWL